MSRKNVKLLLPCAKVIQNCVFFIKLHTCKNIYYLKKRKMLLAQINTNLVKTKNTKRVII